MKTLLILIGLFGLTLSADEKYDADLENFDVSELLNNRRLLLSYSKCLLGKGACTSQVKEFKDKIPEILETRCAKCTERQIALGRQLVRELMTKEPEIWKDFLKKYDPDGAYSKDFSGILNPPKSKQ